MLNGDLRRSIAGRKDVLDPVKFVRMVAVHVEGC